MAAGTQVARDRDHITQHGTCRGRAAGPAPVEHHLAGTLGLDEDRVESIADTREGMVARHHCRMDPDDDAESVLRALCHGEQLDDEAHVARRGHIGGSHAGDALARHIVEGHAGVEGELGEDRRLGSRVETTHVSGGIGLGVAQLLRLGQDCGVVRALLVHLAEDEVGRAVDDAEHLGDAITREGLAQGPQQRNGAGDRSFEVEIDTVVRSSAVESGTISGKQCLVGGHDRRARSHRLENESARRLDAAHDLDDDVAAPGDERGSIRGDEVGWDPLALA